MRICVRQHKDRERLGGQISSAVVNSTACETLQQGHMDERVPADHRLTFHQIGPEMSSVESAGRLRMFLPRNHREFEGGMADIMVAIGCVVLEGYFELL